MCTIVTSALQRQYLQTEFILWTHLCAVFAQLFPSVMEDIREILGGRHCGSVGEMRIKIDSEKIAEIGDRTVIDMLRRVFEPQQD
jgi:hypothetical protein